jgi:two-component system alkaline phosphatase synthesis response regulator PhoP
MQKKILIVDDEEDVLKILEKKLKENNYSCLTASRGQEALNLCKLDKPDLILLDIALPDMDGYTIAAMLRKDKAMKDVSIIFVTGKELEPKGIRERIKELGAYDYISKPCSFQDILDKIKAALG